MDTKIAEHILERSVAHSLKMMKILKKGSLDAKITATGWDGVK